MKKPNWRKRILSLLLGILLAAQCAMPVAADDTGLFVDGSWLTEDSEAMTDELFDFKTEVLEENAPVPYTTYLYGGSAEIKNAGDGKITVYANTKAAVTCDTVKVDIYIQYYSNGAWVYVNNFNYTVKNTSYIARSRTISVTKGRYYRIKCYHEIKKGSLRESCTSVTNGIPI